MKNTKGHSLTTIALMTATMCILGPLSIAIPISPVPISFTNLAIYFSIVLLGRKNATISTIVYLLIGFVGLPVFSGFTGGPGKLLGPTGGYLIGFIFMTFIAGFFVDKYRENIPLQILGMALGTFATYTIGTLWLAFLGNLSFKSALLAGVIPYIPGDTIKIVFAVVLGNTIKKRLR